MWQLLNLVAENRKAFSGTQVKAERKGSGAGPWAPAEEARDEPCFRWQQWQPPLEGTQKSSGMFHPLTIVGGLIKPNVGPLIHLWHSLGQFLFPKGKGSN